MLWQIKLLPANQTALERLEQRSSRASPKKFLLFTFCFFFASQIFFCLGLAFTDIEIRHRRVYGSFREGRVTINDILVDYGLRIT